MLAAVTIGAMPCPLDRHCFAAAVHTLRAVAVGAVVVNVPLLLAVAVEYIGFHLPGGNRLGPCTPA